MAKIFLAEADHDLRTIFKDGLYGARGHDVVATDIDAAAKSAFDEGGAFDVAIIDWPKGGGEATNALVDHMRDQGFTGPIIIISAIDVERDMHQSMRPRLHFDENMFFLLKPVYVAELADKIDRVLGTVLPVPHDRAMGRASVRAGGSPDLKLVV